MPRYRALDPNWIFIPVKEGNWKAGMLSWRGSKGTLSDLHVIASMPSHVGRYSDAHVTFVEGQTSEHVYYQLNNGALTADYVLAPHGWRATYWLNYPALRESTEAEVKNFIEYWRGEGRLDAIPKAV